jgi:GDP-L-fucose synthase
MKKFDDKIYIAGHRGMVGSAVERLLVEKGFTNIITKTRAELNLLNSYDVFDFFSKENPDYVIFAAAKVGGIQANIENPVDFLLDNIKIQSNVIEASVKYRVKRFLFLGSSCVYPKDSAQPILEDYLLNGPLESTNEGYALAKIIGIKLLESYHRQFGFNSISLMPCNLYGPNDSFDPKNSHVLSALVKKISDAKSNNFKSVKLWGTGIAKREFMHVDDLAKFILMILFDFQRTGILNVGSGFDITIKELSDLIKKLVGFKGQIEWDETKPNGMLRKCLDVSKMNLLGFRPQITLEEGIIEVINEYKLLLE